MSSPERHSRKPLHERQTNVAAVRLVPYTPRLRATGNDELSSKSALPTHPAHFLQPTSGATFTGSAFVSDKDVSESSFSAESEAESACSVTTTTQESQQTDQSRPSTATSTTSKRLPKKRKHVALNPDNKTFRVLDVNPNDGPETDGGLKSQSSATGPSLHSSSNDFNGIEASARFPGQGVLGSTTATTPTSSDQTIHSPAPATDMANSPWNYQFVGGLRKVPKTPDLKQKAATSSDSPVPPVPQISDEPRLQPELSTKPSFQSTATVSSQSDFSVYKTYGSSPSPYCATSQPPLPSDSEKDADEEDSHKQPPDSAPPSSSGSNYQILGYSSQPSNTAPPSDNYHMHGDPSPSPSYIERPSPGGPTYSRESLVVAPLQPRARRSTEQFGYYKSRSRESLRSRSLTSISTVLIQEASQSPLSNNPVNYVQSGTPLTVSNLGAPTPASNPARYHMQPYPHQWSSQLSTVPSESEAGTDRGSRSWSDSNGRSSGLLSSNGRHMPSISDFNLEDNISGTNALGLPQPTYSRSNPRLVGDQDEHGDGITDMQELRARPSRTRLSDFYNLTSDTGRTHTMRSTTSSRTNSLMSSAIPAWAQLYYGCGERRSLGAPGSSTEGSDSRPQSSTRSVGSPDTANFPLSIYSPRRRPRQVSSSTGRSSTTQGGSMEIAPVPGSEGHNDLQSKNTFRKPVRPSSSVLSPHLKRDKRASRESKFFMEAPSMTWSTEGNMFGSPRKKLIVMFIAGFVCPFAWIIGAFLPLPPNPAEATLEDNDVDQDLEMAKTMMRQFGPADEARYESARWWRKLNRGMAVLGLMIIIAMIVLAIVGVKERWAR